MPRWPISKIRSFIAWRDCSKSSSRVAARSIMGLLTAGVPHRVMDAHRLEVYPPASGSSETQGAYDRQSTTPAPAHPDRIGRSGIGAVSLRRLADRGVLDERHRQCLADDR